MEFEFPDGEAIPIETGSGAEIGRGLGLGLALGLGPYSADRTVSRCHLYLHRLDPSGGEEGGESNRPNAKFSVSFEVIGKNPIWVCSGNGGGKRVCRRSEKGVLESGDRISLSIKNPFFLVLKSREGGKAAAAVDKRVLGAVERRERRTMERRKEKESQRAEVSGGEGGEEVAVKGVEIELGSVDISQIDPVKEFGFLVKGHEFDHYPRRKIRAIKDWNWFLEESTRDGDDDEVMTEATSSKGKGGRKRKKGRGYEDEDWTEESEDAAEPVAEVGSTKRPSYSTRSNDLKKPSNGTSGGRKPAPQKNGKGRDDEFDEEDEKDETLGGFIVDEEEEAEDKEEEEEEEEEQVDEEEYDDD